jgi:hypothetical protein
MCHGGSHHQRESPKRKHPDIKKFKNVPERGSNRDQTMRL